jgi:hypothetical protein
MDVKTELELIPHRADDVELLAASRPAKGRTALEARRGPKAGPGPLALLLTILVSAAMWVAAAASQPWGMFGKEEDAGVQPGVGGAEPEASTPAWHSSALYASWGTVLVSRPWTDASVEVTASIEVPVEWKIRRHSPSPDYPGLHFTILDQDALPVAMFYFGPVLAAMACRPHDRQRTELERTAMTSGAELLDPALEKAFSYSVSMGPEPRGSFGLLPLSPPDEHCSAVHAAGPPVVVMDFSDALKLGTSAGSGPPRSTYARSFPSVEDAGRYLKSAEHGALKRMITSLKLSFPSGVDLSWQVPAAPARGF